MIELPLIGAKLPTVLNPHAREIKETARPAITLVGKTVVRGPDWQWGEQDSHGRGKVTSLCSENGWVEVEWCNGKTNSYRMGLKGKYDLRVVD